MSLRVAILTISILLLISVGVGTTNDLPYKLDWLDNDGNFVIPSKIASAVGEITDGICLRTTE